MIQSLLTQAEYDACSLRYNTYNVLRRRATKPFRSVTLKDGRIVQAGPPPNYVMGNSLTESEIKLINSRINSILAAGGLLKSTNYNEKK